MRFQLGQHWVGDEERPFVIAELSGNHGQSLQTALTMVEAAAAAGAHAIKLQTYTADTMTLDVSEGEFFISDVDNLWQGASLYQLYQQASTPWEWHQPLFERARALGMEAFSTPFDASAVDFLEQLQVPCYKIASFENNDLPLIRQVAQTGKPLIMSTGMASVAELEEAVNCARAAGCGPITLLKCTSAYPAPVEDANLRTLAHMRELFDCAVGLSDHTLGLAVPLAAVAQGAVMIEKHFVLDRQGGGVDAAFSLEPAELKQLVEESARARLALGRVSYGQGQSEQASKKFRRSLYIAEDVRAGELLTEANLRIIRPGLGLAPKHWDRVLGRRARRDLRKGTPLSWDMLD